jgi:hypothetical protein
VLSVLATGSGAYVPQVADLSGGKTGVLEGGLVWNFALRPRLGLFGQHTISGMWWSNVALLSFGHEAGLRYLCTDHLSFEAAYLGHRVDRAWIDDHESRPGGILDNGAEAGARLRFDPDPRFRIEGRMVGRVFRVYRDTQGVTGLGMRASLMPAGGRSVVLEIEVLRAIRSLPRSGVDRVTWNVVGSAYWVMDISKRLGVLVGARISTNLLVGQVPMLELKRSMIDEPMALGTLGLYFGI